MKLCDKCDGEGYLEGLDEGVYWRRACGDCGGFGSLSLYGDNGALSPSADSHPNLEYPDVCESCQ